ncbi:NAD(P)/FAD-dependent oxidoreductase [Rhodovastum atsumiense]|uniref:NAD(P)/FAD-dependent oxidoreductase n=1 Tax=Rhodovastum atsumiense TaxID=504468 RepID=A0A5M6IPY0_9PROT|nr:NAD(P)/FAD-dependent oxidoreductase [Rhodovastum atsumiense]KAA5610340.1 NAD(P)/FAD-dependent oxidoreductase [Rhodovastum atsumiense]CAH2600918.1 NAD(P)/FAD-dependent oxidoreductase [Rhodovastum atsumiense]
MEEVECVVVGAGVVGIAVARALALAGREVIVLEAAGTIGTETSSRNSEVIHAGIYYPRDSLLARFCVQGRRMLYDFCRDRGVPFAACGKLIVATSESENDRLAGIKARAEANGVEDMRLLTAAEARALEPNLVCTAALSSPVTGVLDSHAYMLALQGEAEQAGAVFVFHSPVEGGRVGEDGIEVVVGGAEAMALRCRVLVNAAGLHAPALAHRLAGMPEQLVPTAYFAKGNYFTLSGRSPFSRLIYPVPEPGGLGVHLTIDLGGQARFGPDVEWIDRIDYNVDPRRADRFYAAVRRYWPGLQDGALQPGYAGIRPKTVPPGAPGQDFTVQGVQAHGVPGLVNLFGIESPGLTAAIALAKHVRDVASGR